jgi:hypothetical protein
MRKTNLTIAMIAAPRQAMTVDQTVASLRAGGFHEPLHVFAEPGTCVGPCRDTTVHCNPRRLGALDNWVGAIAWSLDHTPADHLLIVEDDVAYCRGARQALDRQLRRRERYGFLNLLTPVQVAHVLGQTGPGWIATRRTDIWGTQAVCFSRESAIELVAYLRRNADDPRAISYDLQMLKFYHAHAQWPCSYHVPSLCEHVGWNETTIEKPPGLACSPDRLPLRRGFEFDPNYVPRGKRG